MVDLRDKVKDDRGLLKKIELAIPGFRGYRKREDLRIADRLLREALANDLAQTARSAEEARDTLVKRKELDLLEDMGKFVSRINTSVERVKHAEHGYTGISPDYRIEEAELNKLYEWDLDLLEDIDALKQLSGRLRASAQTIPAPEMSVEIDKGLSALMNFDSLWDQRRESIAGLNVRER